WPHLQAEVRPPRREPPRSKRAHRQRGDHGPKPWLRGRCRLARPRRRAHAPQPLRRHRRGPAAGRSPAVRGSVSSGGLPGPARCPASLRRVRTCAASPSERGAGVSVPSSSTAEDVLDDLAARVFGSAEGRARLEPLLERWAAEVGTILDDDDEAALWQAVRTDWALLDVTPPGARGPGDTW